jgi:hypothetical protein
MRDFTSIESCVLALSIKAPPVVVFSQPQPLVLSTEE